jgi:hypothetical protein
MVRQAVSTADRSIRNAVGKEEMEAVRAIVSQLASPPTGRTHESLAVRQNFANALRFALGDNTEETDPLVEATLFEATATAHNFFSHASGSEDEYDRALMRYRERIGNIFELLPGRFTLFQNPNAWPGYVVGLGLAPALVLDDPPRRQWGMQPFVHAHRYISMLLALITVFAMAMYFLTVASLTFGKYIHSFLG